MAKQKQKKPIRKEKPKDMKKKWGLGALLLLLLVLFFCRGWVRVTLIPKTTNLFYAHDVQAMLRRQNDVLGNPFGTLGFTNVTTTAGNCMLQQAQNIHTEVDCTAEQVAYTKLPTNASAITLEQAHTRALQSLLLADGWRAGSNGVTLTGLVDGTAHGIDYSPDAYYEKIIDGNDCVLDSFIAYANPQPPALRLVFNCDRTVTVLGVPKDELYNSAKGHF